MHLSLRVIGAAVTLSAGAFAAGTAWAQTYPARAIRFVLPFPPGGPTDMLGRAIAQKMAEQVGHPVVPENRPGAGGNLGLELTAKAPPDGYTVALSSSIIALAPSLYKKLNYQQKDLAAVSLVAEIRNVLVVHPSVPAKSVKELIALAAKNPGKLNYGSGGVGTTTHLTPELMMSLTKTKMVHIPFKGSGLALVALTAGEIDVLIMAIPAAAGQVKAGRARALMVFSTERSPTLPDVPSARDLKMEDYIVRLWYGILTPAGTPANLVNRQNAEIVKAMHAPDLRKRLQDAGIEPLTSTPEEFAKFIASQSVLYAKIVKGAGIPPQ